MRRPHSVFGRVERALEIIELGPDVNEARQSPLLTSERREIRKRAQREVDLCDGTRRPIVAHARQKSGLELDRVDQPKERAPGIGIRNDRLGVEVFAGAQGDPRGSPVLHVNAAYFSIGANLCPCGAGCRCERRRERSQPASDEPLRAVTGAHSHQQYRRAPRRPRPGCGSKNASRRKCGTQRFRLEPLRHEIGRRHRRPSQQAVSVFLSQAAEPPAHQQHRPQIRTRRLFDLRRRVRHQAVDERANSRKRGAKLRITARIVAGELRDVAGRGIDVSPEQQAASVWKRRKQKRIGVDQLEAVLGQTQLRHQRGGGLRRMRERGYSESRAERFGNRCAADRRPRLEYDGLHAAARQDSGCCQAVVSAAHENDVGHLPRRPPSFA